MSLLKLFLTELKLKQDGRGFFKKVEFTARGSNCKRVEQLVCYLKSQAVWLGRISLSYDRLAGLCMLLCLVF